MVGVGVGVAEAAGMALQARSASVVADVRSLMSISRKGSEVQMEHRGAESSR